MELQWPLILFTTLLAWSAGVFGAQCLYLLRGQGKKAQMPALIVSVVLLAVGGIAVFFHLEHWERIFNGFGHVTSGITQELIAIIVLFVVMVVYFVYLRRSGDEAKVPAWLAVVGIVMSVVLVAVMGHSYMMASLPAWDSIMQIGSLLGAACGFGPATMAILTACKDEALDYNAKVNLIGQLVNVVLVVAYLIAMQMTATAYTSVELWFDPTSPTQDITADGSTEPFSGASMIWSVVAIIAAAAGVGSALAGKAKGDWKVWGAIGVVCVLVSALALRTVFYMTGVSIYPFF
ncbi:DmsC/YnfH family molybdoenzyme membrane anchor subunit [uncultured Adlercreutzia sp.]|uniref:dimethyl sulfoxide reductase anchor subunit family protein n=1 Tax=uncultured Adlercreutzia sp. TaxID=875803 RepID=UPI0026F3EDEC|nr:DmsC/YnfH family molybdoenzyme membrane anchor subunit [uncultured Adlercreutzia sp.]